MNNILIKEIVEKYYQLDITKLTRKREYVEARAVYYNLVRDNTRMSLSAIGKSMGKDHSTVLHFIKQLKDWVTYDKQIQKDYEILTEEVKVSIEVNPEDFKAGKTIEGFYQKQYAIVTKENKILLKEKESLEGKLKRLLVRYNALNESFKEFRTKYLFLSSRLQYHEPNTLKSEEFKIPV